MDILKDLVLPQSAQNILLLKYLLFLTLLILLPYLSVMIGSTLFSIIHFFKGRNTENKNHLLFAKELIELFTMNKVMAIGLGVVPMLSIIFSFGQLLYGSNLDVTENLVFILLLLISGLFLIYIYKSSFGLKNITNIRSSVYELDGVKEKEFSEFQSSNSGLLAMGGVLGLVILLLVTYILIGLLQLIIDSSQWTNTAQLWSIIFSANSFLYFLFFISMSISVTSAIVMYKYFRDESSNKIYSNDYLNYAEKFSLQTGLIFAFVQPLLFVLSFISSPQEALSFTFFLTAIFILLLMLVISVLFYLMYKDSKTKLRGVAIFSFLILFATLIYKDQLAFDTASKKQMVNLENEYIVYESSLKEKLGIAEILEISGEDIFNGKCIACHRFDTKLVGPAYNDVLPKYSDRREELEDFILNPRKINPDFIAMPSQGLKPNEAKAVAEYIMNSFSANK